MREAVASNGTLHASRKKDPKPNPNLTLTLSPILTLTLALTLTLTLTLALTLSRHAARLAQEAAAPARVHLGRGPAAAVDHRPTALAAGHIPAQVPAAAPARGPVTTVKRGRTTFTMAHAGMIIEISNRDQFNQNLI